MTSAPASGFPVLVPSTTDVVAPTPSVMGIASVIPHGDRTSAPVTAAIDEANWVEMGAPASITRRSSIVRPFAVSTIRRADAGDSHATSTREDSITRAKRSKSSSAGLVTSISGRTHGTPSAGPNKMNGANEVRKPCSADIVNDSTMTFLCAANAPCR